MMYHINPEGKIYPCKARIRKCPYGTDMHAENKEELYLKIMKLERTVRPDIAAMTELHTLGRLKSLYSMNPLLERVNHPIESIITTLDHALSFVDDSEIVTKMDKKWEDFHREASEIGYTILSYGLDLPDDIPEDIASESYKLMRKRLKGMPIEFAGATRNPIGLESINEMLRLEDKFNEYEEYKTMGINEENIEDSIRWMKEDFYQFSHDLNTSKMLAQPIPYENIAEIAEIISQLDDDELLATYDDHLLTNKDVMENVKLTGYFEYDDRPDLNRYANKNLSVWYKRNQHLYENWLRNTPKRVMLSIEMGKELDKRGIARQENATGR